MKAGSGRRGKRESRERRPREICHFRHRVLGIAESKVEIDTRNEPFFVGEGDFFNDFAFKACLRRHGFDKDIASRSIPGLKRFRGVRNTHWRLDFSEFCEWASSDMMELFLKQCGDSSPLYQYACGFSERARMRVASA